MKKIKDFILNDKKNIIIIIGVLLIILLSVWFFISSDTTVNKDKVKEIVLEKTKFKESKVNFRKIELDKKSEKYYVEIDYNYIIFTFVIDANNGKILENSFDSYPDKEFKGPNVHYEYMSKSEVQDLIATELKANKEDIKFIKTSLKKDTFKAIYNIVATYNGYKYEYRVDAISKSIIKRYTKQTKLKK